MSKRKINVKWQRVVGTGQDENEKKKMLANQETIKSKVFIDACELCKTRLGIEIKPTERQASKWNMKKGLAYKLHNNLL